MGLEGAETVENGLEGGTSNLFGGASGIDRHQVDTFHRRQAQNAVPARRRGC